MLRVAMPGVVLKDYSVGVEYLGRMTDTNDKDNAVFNLTFGADVTTVKYALVKEGEDLNKTEIGIIDGSVEATEISEAGRVEVPFEESGNYYLVTVSYENGEAKGADATPITLKSSKDAEEQFDRRCRLNGGPVSSEIHFFDDHFDSVTAKKTRSFSYKDVTKILETKEAFGVVVKADPETVGSARAMIGFPKTALEGNNTDELEFLLERCRNMKRKKVKKF